jgi:magnesium transporter
MLKAYQQQNGGLKGVIVGEHDEIPPSALWLDLFNPTLEERRKVDQTIGNELPTRADMEEIEISSRLYQEGDATFMTAMILAQTDTEVPAADAVTFVLTPERLVTIRYIDPQPFRTYALRCERSLINVNRPDVVLMQLFDAIIDRVADILEKTGGDVEVISVEIFAPGPSAMGSRDFQGVLRRLGQKHGLTTKIRESLLTFGRMLTFLTQATDNKQHKEVRAHLKTLVRDVQSLQDHSTFLAAKLSYLQDATLGLINGEQNNIIKIMSVAAIVFLPPTLLASIWGMNFRNMPELGEIWGYPLALVSIVVAGLLPWLFFKRRGWL